MQCSCGAAFSVQDGPDNLTLLYAERFVSAHLHCGFMTNIKRDVDDETTSYNITKRERREKEY